MGKKTQQNFLDIEFNQVHCKTQRTILIRPQEYYWIASSLPDGLLLLSLAQLVECFSCPNEGGTSLIYSNKFRGLIKQ